MSYCNGLNQVEIRAMGSFEPLLRKREPHIALTPVHVHNKRDAIYFTTSSDENGTALRESFVGERSSANFASCWS